MHELKEGLDDLEKGENGEARSLVTEIQKKVDMHIMVAILVATLGFPLANLKKSVNLNVYRRSF